MPSTPVSAEGVRDLFRDDAFLLELVAKAPDALLELDEPLDDSDIWWWLCHVHPRMQDYGRKDLKKTARQWVRRLRMAEIFEIRDAANAGKFDQFVPPEVRWDLETD